MREAAGAGKLCRPAEIDGVSGEIAGEVDRAGDIDHAVVGDIRPERAARLNRGRATGIDDDVDGGQARTVFQMEFAGVVVSHPT